MTFKQRLQARTTKIIESKAVQVTKTHILQHPAAYGTAAAAALLGTGYALGTKHTTNDSLTIKQVGIGNKTNVCVHIHETGSY